MYRLRGVLYYYFCSFKCSATSRSPKVVRDAGVELVARFHKVALAALFLQTILNLLQGHITGTDLAGGQLPCVHRHGDSLADPTPHHVLDCRVLDVWNSAQCNCVGSTQLHQLELACKDYTAHVQLILHIPECSAGILSGRQH